MTKYTLLQSGHKKITVTFTFVCSYEAGTLRLTNHTNTEHFFGFCLQVFYQAEPPHSLRLLGTDVYAPPIISREF